MAEISTTSQFKCRSSFHLFPIYKLLYYEVYIIIFYCLERPHCVTAFDFPPHSMIFGLKIHLFLQHFFPSWTSRTSEAVSRK